LSSVAGSIERILAGLWTRVQDSVETDVRSLAAVRVIFGVFALLINPLSVAWLSAMPRALFNPQPMSIANWFPSFPSAATATVIDGLLVVTAACIVLGIRTRLAAPLHALLLVLGAGFQYAFGKIDHGMMFPAFLLLLSLTDWGTVFALLPDAPRGGTANRTAPALLALLLCYGFFTAGVLKAAFWCDFDPDTGGFLQWFYNRGFLGSRAPLAGLVPRMPQGAFEAFDCGAVAFELAPLPMLLLGKFAWRGWILVACLFHVMTILLLDISFVPHMPVYLTFIPLDAVLRRLPGRRWAGPAARWGAIGLVAAVTLWQLAAVARGQGLVVPTEALWRTALPERLYGVVVPLALWTCTACAVAASITLVPRAPGRTAEAR
jgi:hypothetical protein